MHTHLDLSAARYNIQTVMRHTRMQLNPVLMGQKERQMLLYSHPTVNPRILVTPPLRKRSLQHAVYSSATKRFQTKQSMHEQVETQQR